MIQWIYNIKNKNMKTKFNFYLDKSIRFKLDSIAGSYSVSVSFLVNIMLNEMVKMELSEDILELIKQESKIVSERNARKNKKVFSRIDKFKEAEEFSKRHAEALGLDKPVEIYSKLD